MNRRKRPAWLLAISFLLLVGLAYLVIFRSPSDQITISHTPFAILPIFFFLLFSFLLSLITYLSRSFRRALLIGLLTMAYLIMRMFRLDSPYFLLLLLALYISLELFFRKHV